MISLFDKMRNNRPKLLKLYAKKPTLCGYNVGDLLLLRSFGVGVVGFPRKVVIEAITGDCTSPELVTVTLRSLDQSVSPSHRIGTLEQILVKYYRPAFPPTTNQE